jgi:hypothetical protein
MVKFSFVRHVEKPLSLKNFLKSGHLRGSKHISAIVGLKVGQVSILQFPTFATFVQYICALCKINNPEIWNFLSNYNHTCLPEQSALRRNYIRTCYEETSSKIGVLCGKHDIWLFINETTNVNRSKAAADVVIWVLRNYQTLPEKYISSVTPGNVCSKSDKNITYFQ